MAGARAGSRRSGRARARHPRRPARRGRAPTIAPMTSSRSPGTMTRLRGPIRSSMCSGSIAPIATPPMTWSRSGPGWIVSPWTPSRTIARVGLDRIGRYGRTPSSGMPWRARPRSRVRASPGLASRSTLLTIAPATLTPWRSNSAALRTISSIGRPDAALGDDDRRRPEHRRDGRVRQPDDRADPGVAGPLDEQDVAVRGERRVGGADPAPAGPPRPRPRCTPG